jgi:hypothetical protein
MPRSDPEFILTLLTKMMNTQVVLLCDKGISASEVALMGYCQLHRLLLAVVDHFPQLRLLIPGIRKRLEDFVHQPETRVKALTPSLGELLALLSVSDSYRWHQLSLADIKESFDLSVLWACSKLSIIQLDENDDLISSTSLNLNCFVSTSGSCLRVSDENNDVLFIP